MSYEYERGPWFVAIAGYLFIRHLEKKLSCLHVRGDVTCCPRAAVSLVMHFSMTMSEVPTKIKRKVTYISYVKRLSISGVGDVTVALEPGSYQ